MKHVMPPIPNPSLPVPTFHPAEEFLLDYAAGTASSGEEAVEIFARLRPDITLMDLNLRGMSGLDAIKAIRRDDSQARVVVLTILLWIGSMIYRSIFGASEN